MSEEGEGVREDEGGGRGCERMSEEGEGVREDEGGG